MFKRFWDWEILVRDRGCVTCGVRISAGTKAVSASYRGKITLCRACRKLLESRIKIDEDECELLEG